MIYYFKLQYKMLNRHIFDFGIAPIIAYILVFLLFIIISLFLFIKTEFAEYIFAFISISLIAKLSEVNRNEFLKSCFLSVKYLKIRLIENTLIVIPFFLLLWYQNKLLTAFFLLFFSSVLSFITFKNKLNFTIPTPFFKYPFEFITGFRKSFYLFIIAYFLSYKSITVDNFNLGLFSLFLVFFNSLSYYFNLESKFYVWIFSLSPKKFLLRKIKTAILYSTALSLPISIMMSIFFFDKILILLAFQLLAYIYLLTVLLAKYSNYPEKISLFLTFFIVFAFAFPPLILVAIPYFYKKSSKNLTLILK